MGCQIILIETFLHYSFYRFIDSGKLISPFISSLNSFDKDSPIISIPALNSFFNL